MSYKADVATVVQRRKDRVLEAAFELFAKKGIESVTMQKNVLDC